MFSKFLFNSLYCFLPDMIHFLLSVSCNQLLAASLSFLILDLGNHTVKLMTIVCEEWLQDTWRIGLAVSSF